MRCLVNFREVAVDNYSDGAGQKVRYQDTPENSMGKLQRSTGHRDRGNFWADEFSWGLAWGSRATRAYMLGAPWPSLLIHRYKIQTWNAINSVSDKIMSRHKKYVNAIQTAAEEMRTKCKTGTEGTGTWKKSLSSCKTECV